MKCYATIAVVGKLMTYETCGIPKILIRIRHCCTATSPENVSHNRERNFEEKES